MRLSRPSTHVALVQALDRAHEDPLAARHEVVQQLLALGVADLLQDDLLRGLRTDATDRNRVDRLFDVVPLLDVADAFDGVAEDFLRLGVLQAEGFVLATLTIDGDADVPVGTRELLGGLRQRRFHRAKHHLALNTLLAGNGIYQQQQLAVHGVRSPSGFLS